MSEDNKKVLLSANAAIDNGDTEGFLSFCTEDLEWTAVGEFTLKGKEAVRQWMAVAYLESPQYTVADLIAEGDFLVAVGDILVKDNNGQPIRHCYSDVWRFHEGKMAELRAFVIKAAVKQG